MNYAYDELQRLITASTTTAQWGLSWTYDGFGNRLNQSVTKGTGPPSMLNVNPANNRISTAGFSYDSNGNMTGMPKGGGTMYMSYDVENRLVSANGETYAYTSGNKRIWKQDASSVVTWSFYGAGGERIMGDDVYFGGKKIRSDGGLVLTDRLGSVIYQGTSPSRSSSESGTARSYFPYGEERNIPSSSDNADKFGTYFRDAGTGLDYADQRFYSSVMGRFLSSDPYEGSSETNDPASFGKYSYVSGDPINLTDPTGELGLSVDGFPTFSAGGGLYFNFGFFGIPAQIFFPGFFFAPPSPPQVVVQSDSRTQVGDKNQAPAALQGALDRLDGNCVRQLGPRNSLKDKAIGVKFWDARSTKDGLLTANIIVPGLAAQRLMDIRYGSRAFTLVTTSGHVTNNVVLKSDFFGSARTTQDTTLVHELLHYYFDEDDDKLAKRLGLFVAGKESSSRITDWLNANCDKSKLK